MNLFSISWLKRLAQSKWFPLVPQLVTLVTFALLVVGGWGISTDDNAFAKILRNTNLANLIVWSYWWPLIIIATVVIGRVWCTVCPVELLTAVCSRIGLKRRVPSWLRSGWIITAFYILILLVSLRKTSSNGNTRFRTDEIYESLIELVEVSGLAKAFLHNRLGNRQAI